MGTDYDRLEARVTRLEDEIAIRTVMARYAHAIDHGDVDAWADCFTGDGRFEVRRPDGEVMTLIGTAELREFVRSRPPRSVPGKHFVSEQDLTIDGDEASARSYFAILTDVDGAPELVFYGRYLDEFLRGGDGRWRFTARVAMGESRR